MTRSWMEEWVIDIPDERHPETIVEDEELPVLLPTVHEQTSYRWIADPEVRRNYLHLHKYRVSRELKKDPPTPPHPDMPPWSYSYCNFCRGLIDGFHNHAYALREMRKEMEIALDDWDKMAVTTRIRMHHDFSVARHGPFLQKVFFIILTTKLNIMIASVFMAIFISIFAAWLYLKIDQLVGSPPPWDQTTSLAYPWL